MERTDLESLVRRLVTEVVDRLEKSGPVPTAPRREEPNPLGPPPPATAVSAAPNVSAAVSAAPDVSASSLRVAIGSDHGGFPLKGLLLPHLHGLGYQVTDVGTHGPEAVDYPDFAKQVAWLVARGAADRGVVIDGAGIGSAMAANKVRGVRAAVCHDLKTVLNSRDHNDANVLSIGSGVVTPDLAKEMVETWLRTPFGGGRHAKRVAKINELDETRAP
ncbi:MAG: ribose 5-phosphate isomerase B [Candidatus Eisenbacteria bacterium]|nr:ribose 5-phosphate isomerase B [Candidatus Eisenbacteria bacterium]